jgi:hypothetical protein
MFDRVAVRAQGNQAHEALGFGRWLELPNFVAFDGMAGADAGADFASVSSSGVGGLAEFVPLRLGKHFRQIEAPG